MGIFYRYLLPIGLMVMSVYFLVTAIARVSSVSGQDVQIEIQIIVLASIGILLSVIIFVLANFTKARDRLRR